MRSQRGFAITLVLYAIIALIFAGLVTVTVYKINHWCNAACHDLMAELGIVKKERDDLREQFAKAEMRSWQLAHDWAEEVGRIKAAYLKERIASAKRFDSLLAAAKARHRDPPVVVSGPMHRLLNDAAQSANGAPSAPGGDRPPADQVPDAPVAYSAAEFAAFSVDAARAYQDAVAQWAACVNFYNGLLAVQEKNNAAH